jgi:hypothetical protein
MSWWRKAVGNPARRLRSFSRMIWARVTEVRSSPVETLEPEPVPTQNRLPSLVKSRERVQWPWLKPLSETTSSPGPTVIALASYL